LHRESPNFDEFGQELREAVRFSCLDVDTNRGATGVTYQLVVDDDETYPTKPVRALGQPSTNTYRTPGNGPSPAPDSAITRRGRDMRR
jgi:hypothetical protein